MSEWRSPNNAGRVDIRLFKDEIAANYISVQHRQLLTGSFTYSPEDFPHKESISIGSFLIDKVQNIHYSLFTPESQSM